MDKKTIGFIGVGNMATAIIKGLISSRIDEETRILGYDVSIEQVKKLEPYGVQVIDNIKVLASQAEFLVLSIKPQNFESVLSELKDAISINTVVISIAAGITENYLMNKLSPYTKVVLVMPNTPLMLNLGATALSQGKNTSLREFEYVCNIFEQSGEIAVVQTNQMNEIIPINGSSPAYIYAFAKAFVSYGKEHGLDGDVCLKLFAQSLRGSAAMLTDSGKSIEELITMVSSLGGTTLEGLSSLNENHFEPIVKEACESTLKRARELNK